MLINSLSLSQCLYTNVVIASSLVGVELNEMQLRTEVLAVHPRGYGFLRFIQRDGRRERWAAHARRILA